MDKKILIIGIFVVFIAVILYVFISNDTKKPIDTAPSPLEVVETSINSEIIKEVKRIDKKVKKIIIKKVKMTEKSEIPFEEDMYVDKLDEQKIVFKTNDAKGRYSIVFKSDENITNMPNQSANTKLTMFNGLIVENENEYESNINFGLRENIIEKSTMYIFDNATKSEFECYNILEQVSNEYDIYTLQIDHYGESVSCYIVDYMKRPDMFKSQLNQDKIDKIKELVIRK